MKKLLALLLCLLPLTATAQTVNTDLLGQGFGKNGQAVYTNKANVFKKNQTINVAGAGFGNTLGNTSDEIFGLNNVVGTAGNLVFGDSNTINSNGSGSSNIILGTSCTVNGGVSDSIAIGCGPNAAIANSNIFSVGSSTIPINVVYFGQGQFQIGGASANYTISGTGGSSANVNGGSVTIAGGLATGIAAPTTVNITASLSAVASGSTPQTNQTVITFGNTQSSHPGLNGAVTDWPAVTWTDNKTGVSGTATNLALNAIAVPTIAATNTGVVTTNAYTLYIAGNPTAGTNQTITSPWALGVGGDVNIVGGVVVGTVTDQGNGTLNSKTIFQNGVQVYSNTGSGLTNATNTVSCATATSSVVGCATSIETAGTPVVSVCGSGSLASGSTNNKGQITGISVATACTITFSTTLPSAPACTFSTNAAITPTISTISTSAVTTTMGALTGTLYYVCF